MEGHNIRAEISEIEKQENNRESHHNGKNTRQDSNRSNQENGRKTTHWK